MKRIFCIMALAGAAMLAASEADARDFFEQLEYVNKNLPESPDGSQIRAKGVEYKDRQVVISVDVFTDSIMTLLEAYTCIPAKMATNSRQFEKLIEYVESNKSAIRFDFYGPDGKVLQLYTCKEDKSVGGVRRDASGQFVPNIGGGGQSPQRNDGGLVPTGGGLVPAGNGGSGSRGSGNGGSGGLVSSGGGGITIGPDGQIILPGDKPASGGGGLVGDDANGQPYKTDANGQVTTQSLGTDNQYTELTGYDHDGQIYETEADGQITVNSLGMGNMYTPLTGQDVNGEPYPNVMPNSPQLPLDEYFKWEKKAEKVVDAIIGSICGNMWK